MLGGSAPVALSCSDPSSQRCWSEARSPARAFICSQESAAVGLRLWPQPHLGPAAFIRVQDAVMKVLLVMDSVHMQILWVLASQKIISWQCRYEEPCHLLLGAFCQAAVGGGGPRPPSPAYSSVGAACFWLRGGMLFLTCITFWWKRDVRSCPRRGWDALRAGQRRGRGVAPLLFPSPSSYVLQK